MPALICTQSVLGQCVHCDQTPVPIHTPSIQGLCLHCGQTPALICTPSIPSQCLHCGQWLPKTSRTVMVVIRSAGAKQGRQLAGRHLTPCPTAVVMDVPHYTGCDGGAGQAVFDTVDWQCPVDFVHPVNVMGWIVRTAAHTVSSKTAGPGLHHWCSIHHHAVSAIIIRYVYMWRQAMCARAISDLSVPRPHRYQHRLITDIVPRGWCWYRRASQLVLAPQIGDELHLLLLLVLVACLKLQPESRDMHHILALREGGQHLKSGHIHKKLVTAG